MERKPPYLLFLILVFALIIRLTGIDWDGGLHLHPDERMLIMVADRIHLFDQLNPHFFNYGSLPLYLLKGASQLTGVFSPYLTGYDGMLYLGRFLSVIFDLITIGLIYKTALFLFGKNRLALLTAFMYAVAFFPIQNSHFFVVDVLLTTLVTTLIYTTLRFLEKPDRTRLLLMGVILGAAVGTKFTAVIFIPIIGTVVSIRSYRAKDVHLLPSIFFLLVSTTLSFFLSMPYAFIDFLSYKSDLMQQLQMNNNPYIFPYTLQYVGTIPYFYYIKNIVLWGLGPVLSALSLIGLLFFSKRKFFLMFYVLCFTFYFLVVGRSAVKFMRYMLPLYPLFCILAGLGLYRIIYGQGERTIRRLIGLSITVVILLWTGAFLNIYSVTHTRIAATRWILKNIPAGATIAREHWDDLIPLYGGNRYVLVELPLYERPDNKLKWQMVDERLRQSEYIVIASNRLYVPLQRLSDCSKYSSCYPLTARYYQDLFSGRRGFKKVAEFTAYPTLQLGPFKWVIDDQGADESFTVYDHPKIVIFKKEQKNAGHKAI